MARAGAVISSLPQPADEVTDEELMAQPDDELGAEEEEQAALDEAAIAEGYESYNDKVETEKVARVQGWRPLAEYPGKPGGWKNAKQFVEDGKSFLPFVAKENRELKEQVAGMHNELGALRTEVATTRAEMQKMLEFARRSRQEGYDKAIADLKAQQRTAVAEGDTVRYDAIEQQIDQMDAAREEGAEAEPPRRQPPPRQTPPAADGIDPATDAFVKANPWVMTDRDLNKAMVRAEIDIRNEAPGMATADVLERAKERVMAELPKKFGLPDPNDAPPPPPPPPPRRPAPPMPPSNQRPQRPAAKTGIDSIADPKERAEARIGFQRARNSMPTITEEEYLEVFNDPHTDVLKVINDHKPKR